jgi:hypothetical protein
MTPEQEEAYVEAQLEDDDTAVQESLEELDTVKIRNLTAEFEVGDQTKPLSDSEKWHLRARIALSQPEWNKATSEHDSDPDQS